MEKKRKELTSVLKNICRPAFEYICSQAGLSDYETSLLVLSYSDCKSEQYIADKMSMSVSSLQKKKRIVLDKMVSYFDFMKMFSGGKHAR